MLLVLGMSAKLLRFHNTFISAKVGLVNMIQDVAQKVGNTYVDIVTDALRKSDMRIMGPSI